MFDLISQMGIFGILLVLILISTLSLSLKYFFTLYKTKTATDVDIDRVLFLGFFALAVGFFSHYLGIYEASRIAEHLKLEHVFSGYGNSLRALLFAFFTFFIAGFAWFALRSKRNTLLQS
jgi:hypothetical protein